MARKNEAEMLLRAGFSPAQIAEQMGVSVGTVLPYLRIRVAEGVIRLSDLFFAIPRETRAQFERAITKDAGRLRVNSKKLPKGAYSPEELKLFLELYDSSTFSGDLYEYLAAIEIALHDLVRATLEKLFGKTESGWWRQGVPLRVRQECQGRREEDEDPVEDPFAYTTLINLKQIMEKHWAGFLDALPQHWAQNKKELLQALDRLNSIRNAVMHPVKKRQWTEDDFEFVRAFKRGLLNCKGER